MNCRGCGHPLAAHTDLHPRRFCRSCNCGGFIYRPRKTISRLLRLIRRARA